MIAETPKEVCEKTRRHMAAWQKIRPDSTHKEYVEEHSRAFNKYLNEHSNRERTLR